MVVRFNFKGYGHVVADIDQSGVLFTGTGQKGSAIAGQGLEHRNGIFVTTVF